MGRENKRHKSSESSRSQSDDPMEVEGTVSTQVILPAGHITRLPLELLAEILSYVPSPRDILALARTSRHFCTVLVNNKATEFIWRQARGRSVPRPIPDFTPNFTEASFAAFLFDPKTCEASVCRKRTREMFHSFELRAALCDQSKCLAAWRSQALVQVTGLAAQYPGVMSWLPTLERSQSTFFIGGITKVFVRKGDWEQAINEYKRAQALGNDAIEAYIETKKGAAQMVSVLRPFYKKLDVWSRAYETQRKEVAQFNQQRTTTFAVENDWAVRDLLHNQTYSTLLNAKNRSLEYLTPAEIQPLVGTIGQEINESQERQKLREKERAQQARMDQVRDTWDGMKTKDKPAPVLPHLREFRKLPVVKIYETEAAGAEKRTMQDPFVASVLAENLEQWREGARGALAIVLGFPGWRNLSRKKLHPVDRLTARFRCSRCDKSNAAKGRSVLDGGGMDFARACEHVCAHLPKKKQSKDRWSAERFVPDQQAIDAISEVLALCCTTADNVDSLQITQDLGDRVQCKSCSLVMDVASVGRHCKRHEDCTFKIVDTPADPPLERGLANKCMTGDEVNSGKVYGCRHCVLAANPADPPPLRLLTFNGLRSHLKEKHLVPWIADEDFFRQKDNEVAIPSGTVKADRGD
ncbi:hypothetical protein C8Q80DRAFT_1261904 [Daedaleopsis nitida]|nr:hypothetical protein C8Q80DRAFT_1261904 [Daedaleopsis nitida]